MTHLITFPANDRAIYSRGRNGDSIAKGFEIMGSADSSSVYLSNINSQGKASNGWTALPSDPETIREAAQALWDVAASIEAERGEVVHQLQREEWEWLTPECSQPAQTHYTAFPVSKEVWDNVRTTLGLTGCSEYVDAGVTYRDLDLTGEEYDRISDLLK